MIARLVVFAVVAGLFGAGLLAWADAVEATKKERGSA